MQILRQLGYFNAGSMKISVFTSISLIALTIMSIFFGSCGPSAAISSVSPDDFEQGLLNGGVHLLDVRTPQEFAAGHIQNAVNIDVQDPDFEQKVLASMKRDKPVYVYCRSGKRSMAAANILAKEGYKVVNLDGGILGWHASGR